MGAAPAADAGLRAVVEGSVEFLDLLPRLVRPEPVDTWQANMLHYFLYELEPGAGGVHPQAVFIADWEHDVPLSMVLIEPDQTAGASAAEPAAGPA
jgi:hypothetical protein